MKTWKLVSGIISIVLFAFVMFQSCAAGISNSLAENGESGGSAGLIVAIILLAGGIVSIATRNGSKGGNIATGNGGGGRFICTWCTLRIYYGRKLCRFKCMGCLVSDLCCICSNFLKEGAMIVYYKHKERKDIYICRIN